MVLYSVNKIITQGTDSSGKELQVRLKIPSGHWWAAKVLQVGRERSFTINK